MTAETTKGKLILHLAGLGSEPFPDLEMAMRVARNAVTELPDVDVEILVQGPSVSRLAEESDLRVFSGPGVTVYACGNSLRSQGIQPTALQSGIEVVAAAVAHIARRQFDGAAYIRL